MTRKIGPTIIKTDEANSQPLKPSVMKAADPGQGGGAAKLQPSVIAVDQKKSAGPVSASAMKPEAQPAPTVSEKLPPTVPSKIPGAKRMRLPVTLDDVKSATTEQDVAILEKAWQYVLETDIEQATKSSVLVWQTGLQKQYSDKVSQLLECTQHEAIAKASGHLSRVVQVLEGIDLYGVCQYEKDGMLSKFLKSSSKEFDTPAELLHAERELRQLTERLGSHLKVLIELQHRLQTLNDELATLSGEIRIAAIAAAVLSAYLRKKSAAMEKIADQFLERSMSLTQTEAQISQNELAREMQLAHPAGLISAIQNTVLVMVPDWLGSVAAMRSMVEASKKVTVTEVEEMTDWKKRIIKLLK